MTRTGFLCRLTTCGAAVLVTAGLAPAAAAARSAAAPASSLDWTQYQYSPLHNSVSPATAITTSNAASLQRVWHWQPPKIAGDPRAILYASPTVAEGKVYIGSVSGVFYALKETTGKVAWSRQLDIEPAVTCSPALGITATAAVLPDPVTGVLTVYVSGARYLYALNAATGAVLWQTRIGPASTSAPDAYYNWSSPTVAAGHIYVGLSSRCDDPLDRGGEVELDQHTGKVLHTWYSVPAGSIGGSIWSSAAVSASGSDVWLSTGNECDPTVDTCPSGNKIGHSLSIVHLSASLKPLQIWQDRALAGHGHDWDFGSSPTLFGGTGSKPQDVGACNKNGVYYALTANPEGSKPIWTDTIGVPATGNSACLASAVWDAATGDMFIGGDPTTINGTTYGGSIREVNPATGSYVWQTGLPCAVMGTPTMDSAGVLAVGTFACPDGGTEADYLINASNGAILATLPVTAGRDFAQLVFAQSSLFVATTNGGLDDFAP